MRWVASQNCGTLPLYTPSDPEGNGVLLLQLIFLTRIARIYMDFLVDAFMGALACQGCFQRPCLLRLSCLSKLGLIGMTGLFTDERGLPGFTGMLKTSSF